MGGSSGRIAIYGKGSLIFMSTLYDKIMYIILEMKPLFEKVYKINDKNENLI